jgi:hypothetical protein
LDMADYPEDITWSIFDGLLYWGVSSGVQAKDPLPPGVLSPRSYAMEIVCKMSVIEHNVDLLLATGSWPRLEEFVRVLCRMTSLSEDIPNREFAIVILNAICASSEPACYAAALETPIVINLISFLELADQNMHQIVQQHGDVRHGMQALRDDPEKMGTSVGMLRRSSTLLLSLARHAPCRHVFAKYQHRLLQFTVSHFMDTRVAVMVAEILYELQRSSTTEVKEETPSSSGHDSPAETKTESLLPKLLMEENSPKNSPSSCLDSPADRQTNGTNGVEESVENPKVNKSSEVSREKETTVILNGTRKRKHDLRLYNHVTLII